MHTVLDLKANRSVAKHDETFEKRLRETCTSSLLVHDDRTKLLKIPELKNKVKKNEEIVQLTWWSPTKTTCLHPRTRGIIHSDKIKLSTNQTKIESRVNSYLARLLG